MRAKGLDEILNVAQGMSNILYNISQYKSVSGDNSWPTLSKQWQVKWDVAQNAFYENFIKL
jgi:hypothetical protein